MKALQIIGEQYSGLKEIVGWDKLETSATPFVARRSENAAVVALLVDQYVVDVGCGMLPAQAKAVCDERLERLLQARVIDNAIVLEVRDEIAAVGCKANRVVDTVMVRVMTTIDDALGDVPDEMLTEEERQDVEKLNYHRSKMAEYSARVRERYDALYKQAASRAFQRLIGADDTIGDRFK